MLRYPKSTASQQALLAPLNSLIANVPACEGWISFLATAEAVFDSLSTGGLQNLSNMARCLANVFDYLYTVSTQSIYSSQYLLNLAISARQVASSASLQAPLSTGNIDIVFTPAAQNALNTLLAWDPVQGYQIPKDPGQLATALVQGATLA
ncbi:MAG: hypothetical protein K6T83_03235 [Alicyclobacillus sp.]|nr:hypothetical protein [Alicyclobacillus sp.]